MTTSDVIVGGVIVLLVLRQARTTFLEHLHTDRPTTRRDLARIVASAASGTPLGIAAGLLTENGPDDATTRAGRGARARWVVSLGVRFGFLVWLYDITDGATLSPFAFAGDIVGGTVWQPVLVVLGLTEVVARVGAIVVRAVRTRSCRDDSGPAVPVETA